MDSVVHTDLVKNTGVGVEDYDRTSAMSDCHLGNFKNDFDNDCCSYIYCKIYLFFFFYN